MASPRPVLLKIEAALEAGNEDVILLFERIGLPDGEELEFFEIPDSWSKAERDFFHYERGNYCLYRLSDSYLNLGIEDFEAAFPALIAANDASRATRAFARMLRQSAFASYSLPAVFDKATMWDQLDWMRKHAPREDVEELDLSLVEMLTRMATGPFNERDALIRGYGLVRSTLSRLFLHVPSRQRSVPYAAAGFWLDIDVLWRDDDLPEVQQLLGVTDRQELRREAYARALELEDGSFYKVGSHTGEEDRLRTGRERHFGNLLTQYESVGDAAGLQAAIDRWGAELGPQAVEAALAQAKENAVHASDDSPHTPKPVKQPTKKPARTSIKKSGALPIKKRATPRMKPARAPKKRAARPAKLAAKPATNPRRLPAKKPTSRPTKKSGKPKRR
jgi:hypothetical protein